MNQSPVGSGARPRARLASPRRQAGPVGKSLRLALAMALTVMMGVAAEATVGPQALPPAAAAITTSPSGSYTVSSTITPTTLPVGGGRVQMTYTVRNNSGSNLYYVNDDNSVCTTSSSNGAWIAPEATATFSCTATITSTTDVEQSFTFWSAANYFRDETTTLADTVAVAAPGGTLASCDTPYYSSFFRDGSIGTVDPATGTPTVVRDIPPFPSAGYWNETTKQYEPMTVTGSSALAIDPSDPRYAYFSGRNGAAFSDELFRMDLTTGEIVTLGYSAAFDSNRYAIDGSGTLWTLADGGHLYSLANVGSLRGYQTGTTTAPELPTEDHGIPTAYDPNTGRSVDFATLTSGDVAFDGTGTMWVLASAGTNATNTWLLTIGPDALASSTVTGTVVGAMGAPRDVNGPGTYFNGLAFDSNGVLYASSVDDVNGTGNSGFYTINKATGAPTLVGTPTSANGGTGDLASCALPVPRLEIKKMASPVTTTEGGRIDYTITIENVGEIAASGVTFTDLVPTGTTYIPESSTLNGDPVPDTNGSSHWSTKQYVNGATTDFDGVIPQNDTATIKFSVTMQPGQTEVCNQGTVTDVVYPDGVLTDDPTKSGSADKTCVAKSDPKLQIIKRINGEDADAAPGVPVSAGATMNVTFEVTNTGNTVLEPVVVTDDKIAAADIICRGVDATDDNTIGSLQAGRTALCIATTPAPAVGVQHTDTATATGTPPGGTEVTDTNPANAYTPGLAIQKQIRALDGTWQDADTVDAAALVAAGAPLQIRFQVTNPGLAPLQDVTVTDTAASPSVAATDIVCAPATDNVIPTLAAGQTVTCTATAAGPAEGTTHRDVGIASASPTPIPTTSTNPTPSQPAPVVASNPAHATPQAAAAWAVRKSTADAPVVVTGSTVQTVTRTYTVTLTNAGGAEGTAPEVFDTPSVPNGFTIEGVTIDGEPATVGADGRLVLPGGQTLAAGASLERSVVVTYSVAPAAITAADWAAMGSCQMTDGNATSGPGAGLYNVVALPSGTADSDGAGNNDVCTNVTGTPAVQVVKSINGDDANQAPGVSVAAGSTMDITFDVTNTGSQALSAVTVTDDKVAAGSITCEGSTNNVIASLAPGQTVQCRATLQAPTTASTTHTNTATVTGTPPATPATPTPTPVTDTDPANATTPGVATFAVAKTTTEGPVTLAPDAREVTRTYTVSVTNTSAVDGTSAQVVDVPSAPAGFTITQVVVDGDAPQTAAPYVVTPGDQLAAGASREHTVVVTYAVDPAAVTNWSDLGTCDAADATPDATKGLYNLVTMDGDSDGVANNDACTPVTGTPGIQIVKRINGDDADNAPGTPVAAGSTMNVTFEVTNTGNVPLTNVVISDDKIPAGSFTGCPTTLAPGQTVTCSATLAAPQSGTHTNTATVTGTPPTPAGGTPPPPVTDDNPANASVPSVQVVKKINGDDANATPGVAVADGSTMDVTFEVTNTGAMPLTNIRLADDKPVQGLSCPRTELAPGEAMTCTATLAAPAPGVQHTDTATVTGTPATVGADGGYTPATHDDGTPVPDVTDDDPANAHVAAAPRVQVVKRINGDDANTAPGVPVAPGADMAITFEVTNTGNVALNGVTVTDDRVAASAITCPAPATGNVIGTLEPGASVVCTATLAAPADGAQHTNTATVTGTPPATPDNPTPTPVTDKDPGNAAVPSISIVKSINGDDANTAAGVSVTAGSTMDITYLVTNTGKVTLSSVTVTDDKPVQGLRCPQTVLAPGDAMSCTATLAAPAPGVQHANTGTATGVPSNPDGTPYVPANPDGTPGTTPLPPVRDEDPAHAIVPATPSVSIVKKINGDDANTAPGVKVPAGSDMAITYTVTNTGNLRLTDLEVVDDKVATVNCPATELEPQATMECTATLAAPAGGVQHTNTGTVTGTPVNGDDSPWTGPDGQTTVSDDDPANAFVPGEPGIRVVKRINGDDAEAVPGVAVQAGSTMAVTFEVTNTGNVPLADVTLVDDTIPAGSFTCPRTTLAVGEQMTCTAAIPAPATGVQHSNTVTATGTPPKDPDGTTPPAPRDDDKGNAHVPSVSIVKSINGDDANAAPGVSVPTGSTMDITYLVTNTGLSALGNITVTDDKPVEGLSCPETVLAPGEAMTCTATLAAPAAGVQHTNTGTVTGTPGTVDPQGGFTPSTTPEGSPVPDVSDDDPANAHVAKAPAIQIVKRINDSDANTAPGVVVEAGSMMRISYDVTNTGNMPLADVTVGDDKVAAQAILCPKSQLAPGEAMQCTAELPAPKAGAQHTNTGTVTGTPVDPDGTPGTPVTDEDPANATVAAIQVVKLINGHDANTAPGVAVDAGSAMQITYRVTNTGLVTLNDVTVRDDKPVQDLRCPGATLAPGASMECTATLPAPAVGEQHTNTGTATGTPPAGEDGTTPPPVSDDDPANAAVPAVSLVKKINGDDANAAPGVPVAAGSTMQVHFEVANTGKVALRDVTVTDDTVAASAISCPNGQGNVITSLAPGRSVTCTATLPAPKAGVQHTNTGSVVGTPEAPKGPDGTPEEPQGPTVPVTPVTDTDKGNAHVPSITIVKAINGDDANTAPGVAVEAGSTMAITYRVTNTGIAPLADVTVGDDKVADVDCPKTTLDAGESMTCTASLVAPKVGTQHTNTGTVVATPGDKDDKGTIVPGKNPDGTPRKPVTDKDPANAHVPAISITKLINGEDADTAPGVVVRPGSTMQITYRVTNIGLAPLTGVAVSDDKVAAKDISCPRTTLAAGQSMTCTATLAAPKAGVLHTNVGTATGLPPKNPDGSQPPRVSDDNPANATGALAHPALALEKRADLADANSNGYADAGEVITYSFIVTNTGDQTLAPVVIDDPMLGLEMAQCVDSIAPGERVECETVAQYTVTRADVQAGTPIVNVAQAFGGQTPSNPDSVEVPVPPLAATPRPPAVLSNTGSDVSPGLLAAGVLSLLAGAGLVAVDRRRRR